MTVSEEQKQHCRQPCQLSLDGVVMLTGMGVREIAMLWDLLAMEHDWARRRTLRNTALCQEPSQHVSSRLYCAQTYQS